MSLFSFQIAGHTVEWWDLAVAGGALVVLLGFLIFIIVDIKKSSRERKAKTEAVEAGAKESKGTAASSEKRGGTNAAAGTAAKDKSGKRNRKGGRVTEADPLTVMLGFDPYAPVPEPEEDLSEAFHDSEQETEDMRTLREKVRSAHVTEEKLTEYRTRDERIRYELGKVTRYLRDNRAVLASLAAVSEKLGAELAAPGNGKKVPKADRAKAAHLAAKLGETDSKAEELRRSVERRANDERLLKEAQNHVLGEIARSERDLSLLNSDIDRLNSRVGAELRQIENEGRARALMAKYSELKPLLVNVNSTYREITALDARISAIHARKREIRSGLDGLKSDLKAALGADESEKVAEGIMESNDQMLSLDGEEERLIGSKEAKIREFRSAKRKANDFLEKEKYSFDDLVVAEDKIVGELEFERLRREFAEKKETAEKAYETARGKYDALISKKVKFGKKDGDLRLAHEEQIRIALSELKAARVQSEKAANDYDRVLPTVTPSSLVTSGSGVLSREWTSRRRESGMYSSTQPAPVRPAPRPSASSGAVSMYEGGVPSAPNSANYNATLTKLLARLDALERFIRSEKQQRAGMRAREREYAPPVRPESRLEQRRAQVVAMRKGLRYIDSPEAAREFRQKLYAISISLSEEEMNDNVLSELIRRTMNDAAALGDRAARAGRSRNGYRS